MSETLRLSKNDHVNNGNPEPYFPSKRWSHAIEIADQLRQNTKTKKNEQLRQYALDIPLAGSPDMMVLGSPESLTDSMSLFHNELLSTSTGNFSLDNLTKRFLELKQTFNRMLELDKDNVQRVVVATSITKAALLMVLRSTESIVEIVTKGTRHFPTLNSLISYIRSRHTELPINGGLLVDWYKASHVLDLLLNDPDWLVQPSKAFWAMQVCTDTLAWARVVFNESYRKAPAGRPIFDRDDSMILLGYNGQE